MKILLDMDDVQSLFVKEWVNRYNDLYDDDLNYLDITAWNIENFVLCTKEQIYSILDFKHFFRHVEPEKDARRVIDRLRDAGHEVVTVTATYNPKVCEDKAWWLKEYMGFKQEDIIYCIKKYLIKGDLLLDDGSHNIRQFTGGKKVIFDRPHNQDLREYEYDVRVRSWKEFETYCELNEIL